ncbi:hypothetical protein F2Q69_00034028 [Brassica cretica]|uniref:Uncharacterized protein n=1 Tax=Brassica cretica TaxID=69181 RepID=A0A8S9SHX5_BRACR|nr:hypothetical protein F2Q69_00034028 [Brassica cretica]
MFGLDISLVSDDNIRGARIKIMWDVWEAANDPELIERMSKYEAIKCSKPAEYVEIENGEKRAPKKTKEAAPSATQTRDTTATSSSSQPESDETREAAPWPRDPLTPFSKLSTIHGAHISTDDIETNKVHLSSLQLSCTTSPRPDMRHALCPSSLVLTCCGARLQTVLMYLGKLNLNAQKPGLASGSKISGSSSTRKVRSRITY